MWRRRILGVGIPTLVAVLVIATAAVTATALGSNAGSSSVGTTISIRALLKNNDDDDDDAAFDEEEDYDNTSIVHEEFYRNCWKEKQNSDNYNNNKENDKENGSDIIDYTCMLTSLHLRTIRQVYVQQEVERLLRNSRESSSDKNDDSMMEKERDRYNFVLIYDSKYLTLHDDDTTDVEENSPPNGASRNNWEHEQQERFFAAPSSSIVHNDLNKMLYRNFKVRQQQQQQIEDNHTDDELLTEQPIVIQLYCPIGSDNSADLLRHLLMTRPEQRNVLIHTRDQICRTNSGNNDNTHTGNHNHNTDIPLPMYLINTACMATVLEQYTTVTTPASNNNKKKNQSFNDVLIDSCTSFVSTRPYGISRHHDNDDNDNDTVSGQYTDNSYTTKKKNHEEIVFLRSLQQTEQMYTYFFQQLLQQQQQQQYQHQNNGNGNGDDNNDDWTILSDGSILSSSTGTGDDDNNNRDRHRHEEKTELEEQQDFSQRAQQTLQSIMRDISPEEFAQYKQRYCEMNTRKEKTGRRADGGDATKTTNIIPTAYQDDDNGGDVEDDVGSSSSYNDKSDHDDETSPQPRILWDDEELLPTFDTKEDLLADTTGWSIYLDAVYGLDTFVTTNKNNNNKNAMTGHDHDDNVQKDETSIFPLKLSHHLTFFYWDMVPVSFKEQIMASYPHHEQQHTIHDGNDNDSNKSKSNDNNPIHVLPVRPMYNADLYNIFKLSQWEDFLSLDRDLAWRYMHRSILPFWRTIHSPYNATGVNEEKDSLDVLLPPKPNQQQQQQQQQQQHRSLRYVDTGFADNALVEVMHACCDFGRQDYSSGYWYFVAKGSGVYFDVGKTIIFDDHADAYDTLGMHCSFSTFLLLSFSI